MNPVQSTSPAETEPAASAPDAPNRLEGLIRFFSYKNIGVVYVWLAIIVLFTLIEPDKFPTKDTVNQVLNNSAITGIAALALLIPLCARAFDLSIGFVMSLSGVTAAYFQAKTGIGLVPSVLLGLGAAFAVGVINAFVVIGLRVDSFIGTLATGSLVAAFITLVTNEQNITDVKLAGSFSDIGQTNIEGFTLPVAYMFIVAAVLWYLLEHTKTGRRIYAAGFNPDASRLMSVRVDKLRAVSLLCSATIAGIAGVALASTLSSGSGNVGQSYLLPAFAAAFLGATQLRAGRFNAWGTVLAVIVLETGITGLGLARAPSWAPSMFTGVVLISALALTGAEKRMLGGLGAPWERWRRRRRGEPETAAPEARGG